MCGLGKTKKIIKTKNNRLAFVCDCVFKGFDQNWIQTIREVAGGQKVKRIKFFAQSKRGAFKICQVLSTGNLNTPCEVVLKVLI
jgi:hypothetical protein